MNAPSAQRVIDEFRACNGRVGGDLADTPLVLIRHLGARTRTHHVTPLAYGRLPEGQLVIAASNGGSPTHPAWYHNLKAHPTVEVELGAETFMARADELTGPARARVWARLIVATPTLVAFQAMTPRQIPLITLTRVTSSLPGR